MSMPHALPNSVVYSYSKNKLKQITNTPMAVMLSITQNLVRVIPLMAALFCSKKVSERVGSLFTQDLKTPSSNTPSTPYTYC